MQTILERYLGGALLASAALGTANAQNLLTNPSFEQGLTGWTRVSGSSGSVIPYGSQANIASVAVGTHIGGGNRVFLDTGGNSIYEQVVPLAGLPAGAKLRLRGFVGGRANDADDARLLLIFRDPFGALATRALGYGTVDARNREQVLILREGEFEIPQGATDVAVRFECRYLYGSPDATVDNVSLVAFTGSLIPPPLPLSTQLLTNPGFESGWTATSPLTLIDRQSWEGRGGALRVAPYSDTDPNVPGSAVANIVGGGTRLAVDLGDGRLVQTLDVRGNAAQIANGLALQLRAYAGGVGSDPDYTRVELRFLDSLGAPVGAPNAPVGPVFREARNFETVVVAREREWTIPAATAYIEVLVACEYVYGSPNALVDNVTARLVPPSTESPLPLYVNVVRNSSFELGTLPGSPLDLNDANGWFVAQGGQVLVQQYGTSGSVPAPALATANGLGSNLGVDSGGNARLTQVFTLEGLQDLINQGRLRLEASAWLGGVGTDPDGAHVDVTFLNVQGVAVGNQISLPRVTPAERANQTTLLQRRSGELVPGGAKTIVLAVQYDYIYGSPNGLADRVELLLSDVGNIGTRYCTSEANSTGSAATISAVGSASILANDLTLVAGPIPNQLALFLSSPLQGNSVFGNGTLCIANPIRRLGPVQQATGNRATKVLNLPIEVSVAGTLHFQCWFRDPAAGGAFFDASNALTITFTP
ncbi:MAG: hypothetical protein R3F49_16095 [Planctomycetota bacterium]